MEKCEQCGNAYNKIFHVKMKDHEFAFDSFECAIERLAPRCHNCGTRIVGHGVESRTEVFCCAHCARAEGITDLKDHSESDSQEL
ncbi:MAG: hypothetical protein H0V66_16065 [Bdellovibrionales bacterium]|nr:hypothetical protein [Bdellovibrionales bacterium]